MIQFVNAKINLGLNIVRRRPDGYHDLETVFYPVGLNNGKPCNPDRFCDILEISPSSGDNDEFCMIGRAIECSPEQNLVSRAVRAYRAKLSEAGLGHLLPARKIVLEKFLPDGAGLGGGSADASFTLKMLNELAGNPFSDETLTGIALSLGADCPFFIYNRPMFGAGVGERLRPIKLDLSGKWCMIVKPGIHISTREAFAGITPRKPDFDLRRLEALPVSEWRDRLRNDFEASLFPKYPVLAEIKRDLYDSGALYAQMSGSGSSLFGLYPSQTACEEAACRLRDRYDAYTALCML